MINLKIIYIVFTKKLIVESSKKNNIEKKLWKNNEKIRLKSKKQNFRLI